MMQCFEEEIGLRESTPTYTHRPCATYNAPFKTRRNGCLTTHYAQYYSFSELRRYLASVLLLSIRNICKAGEKMIHQALVQGKVCFLASEEWQQLDDMENRTEVQAIFYRVLRQMTHWPTLLCEKRAILCNDGRTTSLTVFLKGAREVKKAMDDLGQELDTLIKAHRLCQYIQSTCLFDMVSEMYKMDDTTVGMVLCYHAMYSIVVLRVIWSLADPFDQLILEAEILHLCKRVWMLIEHGQSVNWETQDRIIEIINELERFRERGRNTWTREGLINKAMFYRGDWVTHVG
ncbi:uncharacterized protein N7458_010711 [Penicillium daleae]|uniref:Uncharacterized protein n=1 Tax=Penicillium daleae TaxID=63821 RepID=A0AAD6BZ66_9EURO|nr:uncharacterized protein N7458_010711 [Penicillium daleae]KAJ5439713.1 hypothetical protein N7458_010711 [Penicillium daleae]